MSPDEVRSADPEDVSMLWQAITPLEAREMLAQIRIVNNPWTAQSDKSDLHSKTVAAAYPFAEARSMTFDDLAIEMSRRAGAIE